jgi:hypothetical protein
MTCDDMLPTPAQCLLIQSCTRNTKIAMGCLPSCPLASDSRTNAGAYSSKFLPTKPTPMPTSLICTRLAELSAPWSSCADHLWPRNISPDGSRHLCPAK